MSSPHDGPFASLLTGSLAGDAAIRPAAFAIDGMLRQTDRAVPNLLLYARLLSTAGCATNFRLLPALERLISARGGLKPLSTLELERLAWQFHVDFREVAHTDRKLAEMIVRAIPWHRIKGTPASLKQALGLFGYEANIEISGPGPYWATYQLGLPRVADTATVQSIVNICNTMAPARCRLWRIYTAAFDRRPIALSLGPVLGDGWLSFYSGTPVSVGEGDVPDEVLVSFGARNIYEAEVRLPVESSAGFGATTRMGFLIPYLDSFTVGRSHLSGEPTRHHGFFMRGLFSSLWADRVTTGRRWSGSWNASPWLEYAGVDRKLPPWRMERRSISRARLVPGWSDGLGDINARLGVVRATVIDAPMRLSDARLSEHDSRRRNLCPHEMRLFRLSVAAESLRPEPLAPADAHRQSAGGSTRPVLGESPRWSGAWDARRWGFSVFVQTAITHYPLP